MTFLKFCVVARILIGRFWPVGLICRLLGRIRRPLGFKYMIQWTAPKQTRTQMARPTAPEDAAASSKPKKTWPVLNGYHRLVSNSIPTSSGAMISNWYKVWQLSPKTHLLVGPVIAFWRTNKRYELRQTEDNLFEIGIEPISIASSLNFTSCTNQIHRPILRPIGRQCLRLFQFLQDSSASTWWTSFSLRTITSRKQRAFQTSIGIGFGPKLVLILRNRYTMIFLQYWLQKPN